MALKLSSSSAGALQSRPMPADSAFPCLRGRKSSFSAAVHVSAVPPRPLRARPCGSGADLLRARRARPPRCAQKLRLRNEALLPRRFLPRRSVFFLTGRFRKIVDARSAARARLPAAAIPLRELRFQIAALFAETLELVGTREDAGVFSGAAAGHRTAGVQNLSVERHDAEAVIVPACNGDGVGERFRNGRAPEKARYDGAVAFIAVSTRSEHTPT